MFKEITIIIEIMDKHKIEHNKIIKSKIRFGIDAAIQVHADSVIVFDFIIEKNFHKTMGS